MPYTAPIPYRSFSWCQICDCGGVNFVPFLPLSCFLSRLALFSPFPLSKFLRKKCNSVTILQGFKNKRVKGYTFWLHFFKVTKKSVTIVTKMGRLHFCFESVTLGYIFDFKLYPLIYNTLSLKNDIVTQLHFFRHFIRQEFHNSKMSSGADIPILGHICPFLLCCLLIDLTLTLSIV